MRSHKSNATKWRKRFRHADKMLRKRRKNTLRNSSLTFLLSVLCSVALIAFLCDEGLNYLMTLTTSDAPYSYLVKAKGCRGQRMVQYLFYGHDDQGRFFRVRRKESSGVVAACEPDISIQIEDEAPVSREQ